MVSVRFVEDHDPDPVIFFQELRKIDFCIFEL
jgi:hypothetical protein